MTPERFAELSARMRGTAGTTRQATYYHLVDGHGLSESARMAGCTPAAMRRCVDRMIELDAMPVCPYCDQVMK